MDTPTYTSDGMEVYKPQPGEYWKDGLRFRESYGGVIAELQDLIVEQSGEAVQSYPQNFAGIIAAINTLGKIIKSGNLPNVGVRPPGWEVIIDPNTGDIGGDWISEPEEGTLWFDTRQGRLFVAVNGEYWQTNGADGLAAVSDELPTNPPVIGSTWYETKNGLFYVYVGKDEDGISLWEAVKGQGEVSLTTATLPLAISRSTFNIYDPTIIPDVPVDSMNVQKDFNEYIYASLLTLDKAVTENTVTISDTAPVENVVNGTLWYDSSSLELSVWYVDNDGGQWVPTSVSYPFDDELTVIRTSVTAETTAREHAITALLAQIETIRQSSTLDVDALETKITALESHVTNHPAAIDLTGYATEELVATNTANLLVELAEVEDKIPDVTSFVNYSVTNQLETAVDSLPTVAEVGTLITAALPDVSSYVSQSDIDTSISNITNAYLPRNGGVLTGSFQLQKTDYGLAALDFSGQSSYSHNAIKLSSNSTPSASSTFGSTDNPWEYAWEFGSEEDFCWIYNDTNKVFSITKDGPACSNLYIGNFQANTNDGRVITNKIDVKDRLTTYQTAFENVRQAVSDSTDYATLRSGLLTALASV